jgi:hypothetical protein
LIGAGIRNSHSSLLDLGIIKMEIVDSTCTSLKSIGKDTKWLCDWILERPSRLGLGDIEIRRHKIIQHRNFGGHVYILAYRSNINTFYEIKIMFDECGADYALRILGCWLRGRISHPDSKHVAVLAAEDLSREYKELLEGLPQILPFIGIEFKVLKLAFNGGVVTILPCIITQSNGLVVDAGDEPNIGIDP